MTMPNKGKLYVASMAIAGLALLAGGLAHWASSDLPRFFSYLILALLASTLKVHLPRFSGTMSVNFLFILVGIADHSFSETLAMGCAAALLQSVWRTRQRPRPVQVVFNVASLALSIGVAFGGSHFILASAGASSLLVLLALAASLFFLTNTVLVSTVVSLMERKPLWGVWRQCYSWAFPYYLVGAGVAGLMGASNHSAGRKVSLLPMMYMVYLYYGMHLERAVKEAR
jgi:hypothetical protein